MTAMRRALATHVTDARPVDTPLPSVVILRNRLPVIKLRGIFTVTLHMPVSS